MTTAGSSVQSPLDEVVQQAGQRDLRHIEQEVDILGESGTTAKHESPARR